MPTYDYRCKQCGHEFELFQSMSEGVKRKCPECKKNSLERLIGAGAGLIFKGSGYYLTDYRSKSYEEGAKAEKDAARPASKSDEKSPSSDAKPSGEASARGAAASEGGAQRAPKSSTPSGATKKSAPRKRRS